MNSTNSNDPPTGALGALGALKDVQRRLAALEQRQQQAAQVISTLADSLGYPISSIHLTRIHLREIAAILRGDSVAL